MSSVYHCMTPMKGVNVRSLTQFRLSDLSPELYDIVFILFSDGCLDLYEQRQAPYQCS